MNIVKINGIEFDVATLKAATWIEEHRRANIIVDTDEDGCLSGRDAACEDEDMWQAQTCESVMARDGKAYSVCMVSTQDGDGCAVCPASDGPAVADHNSKYEIEDEDGYDCSVGEVAVALDLDLADDNCLPEASDYESAAKSYVEENADARFYIDRERGFANEWTLHVLTGEAEPDEDWELVSNPVAWLKDALMDADTYHGEYLADKAVGAIEG